MNRRYSPKNELLSFWIQAPFSGAAGLAMTSTFIAVALRGDPPIVFLPSHFLLQKVLCPEVIHIELHGLLK